MDEADVGFTGEDGGHGFVGSKAGNQLEVDALFSEVAVFDGHVLRCIENGMGYFV